MPNTILADYAAGIDLIEEHEGGLLKVFEFKQGKNKKTHFPQTFTENYAGTETLIV